MRRLAARWRLRRGPGDRVAALCANSHVMLELHNAVPCRGAVLVSLNIRLSADEMGYIVAHSGARSWSRPAEFADGAPSGWPRAGVP